MDFLTTQSKPRIDTGNDTPISLEEIATSLQKMVPHTNPISALAQEYAWTLDANTQYTIALGWTLEWAEDFQKLVDQMNEEFAEETV